MGEVTDIEWCQHTWNAWFGCVKVSPLCDNCYAEGQDKRFGPSHWGTAARRKFMSDAYWQQPLIWNRKAKAAGERRRVFAFSMGDVFEKLPEGHPDAEQMENARARLWRMIEQTPWLDWLLLTKRLPNVERMVPGTWLLGAWPKNVWLGTSIGTQQDANREIPRLVRLPAPVRFLSMEPLLECVKLWRAFGCGYYCDEAVGHIDHPFVMTQGCCSGGGIHWVITGGESGKNARPSHPDWIRSLRDECADAGVAFFFKQWGEWVPTPYVDSSVQGAKLVCIRRDGSPGDSYRDGVRMLRVGKQRAGRILDGQEWAQFPEVS